MSYSRGYTVFVPVFNEEYLLTTNITRLVHFLESSDTAYEIIIGSNGSTDMTCELGRQLCEQHKTASFFHLRKKGVGAAFREGVKRARYDRIITVDIDLSINLEFIHEAYRLLAEYDIVVGSKIMGNQKRSWIRRMASNCFIRCAKLLLKVDFQDYSIAAKGYRTEIVKRYLPYVDEKTFYVIEIVHRAYHEGYRLKEIPVQCHDTRGSRFNLIYEGIYKFSSLFRLWIASMPRY